MSIKSASPTKVVQTPKEMLHDGKVYQQFCSLKNNETLDHVTLPPERRDKSNYLHDKLEGKIYMEMPKG